MQTYEEHKVVSQEDLDDLKHVNNVTYVQWVQDIAEKHWDSKKTQDMTQKYYWVLIEHTIRYISEALIGDVLKLLTYVDSSEGVKSIRIVEIYNHNTDELLVKSTTTWCLMSKETHRPVRIPESIKNIFD